MDKPFICVATGSRADYGLLYPVIKQIQDAPDLTLAVAVTGMHLCPEFGMTVRQIETDGFCADARVEMQLSSDTPVGVAKSMGLGVIGFADAFERIRPDLLLVLGDRFEILAAVQAALVAHLPVAHLCGGDTTEGAFDESIRHAITKCSHLHFPSNDEAATRILQMGENPAHVFTVGSPGIDHIRQLKLLSRNRLESELGIQLAEKNLVVTYHPETLAADAAEEGFSQLLHALAHLAETENTGIIFTFPNADTGARALMEMIDVFVQEHPAAYSFVSLGQIRYLSLVAAADAIIGNSSSGLYEAPSLKTPTVNIGDRQKGRIRAESVIDCRPVADDIAEAIRRAFVLDCATVQNPYGDGFAADRIVKILGGFQDFRHLLRKSFFRYTARD